MCLCFEKYDPTLESFKNSLTTPILLLKQKFPKLQCIDLIPILKDNHLYFF
jgi:hypothetical protein